MTIVNWSGAAVWSDLPADFSIYDNRRSGAEGALTWSGRP